MKTIKFNAAEWHAAMIREHYESIGEKSSLKYRLLCNVEFVIGRLYDGWRYGVGLPCRLFQLTTTVIGKLHYTACCVSGAEN